MIPGVLQLAAGIEFFVTYRGNGICRLLGMGTGIAAGAADAVFIIMILGSAIGIDYRLAITGSHLVNGSTGKLGIQIGTKGLLPDAIVSGAVQQKRYLTGGKLLCCLATAVLLVSER